MRDLSRKEMLLIDSNNSLALRLYQDLMVHHRYQNILFSPLCLTLGLATVAGVIKGRAQQEIEEILNFDVDENMLNVIKQYSSSIRAPCVEFIVKIFVDSTVNASGTEHLKKKENASDVILQDFNNPDKSRELINEWAIDESHGEIRDLLPDGAVFQSTMLILTNGTYCKTNWSKPFFRVRTKERVFEISEEEKVKVEMMELEEDMLYGYSDKLEAEIIQMKLEADDLSMAIILPESSVEEIEQRLDGLNITDEIESLGESSVRVRLPKFIQESTRNFKEFLQSGISNDHATRDFSLFSRSIPFICTSIFQKAIIEVDEGIEPTVLVDSATLKERPIDVFCDHPFIYIILYKKAILLMGKFFEPPQVIERRNERSSWARKYWKRVKLLNKERAVSPKVGRSEEPPEEFDGYEPTPEAGTSGLRGSEKSARQDPEVEGDGETHESGQSENDDEIVEESSESQSDEAGSRVNTACQDEKSKCNRTSKNG